METLIQDVIGFVQDRPGVAAISIFLMLAVAQVLYADYRAKRRRCASAGGRREGRPLQRPDLVAPSEGKRQLPAPGSVASERPPMRYQAAPGRG